jgi:chemotaxis protein methyltransferase CheR
MRTGTICEPDIHHDMPLALVSRYFQPCGAEWQINDDVRGLIEFRTLDIVAPWPVVDRFDLIILCGTLPYYESVTRQRILVRLHNLLSDDGYLLLGEDEMTDEADSAEGRWRKDAPGLYRLRGTPSAQASSRQIRTVIANATEEAD